MLTVSEFAERSGYSVATVRRWVSEGLIKGKQPGKRKNWVIPSEELDKIPHKQK